MRGPQNNEAAVKNPVATSGCRASWMSPFAPLLLQPTDVGKWNYGVGKAKERTEHLCTPTCLLCILTPNNDSRWFYSRTSTNTDI